jgi:hypothetical protein
MNPRVKSVQPLLNYRLRLSFTNGEVRLFDVKPYLTTGIFQELRGVETFNSVRAVLVTGACSAGRSICATCLSGGGMEPRGNLGRCLLPVYHGKRSMRR